MTTKTAPAKPFANAKHHAGCFWWTDLSTTDEPGARAFYGDLFGWTYDVVPVGERAEYAMAQLDGKLNVAAISGQQEGMQGLPPIWTSYLTVDDVDATTAKVVGLGGTVVSEPFDVMDVGRMSLIQDPSGATVALWQTITNPGAAAVSQPGAYAWSELLVRGDIDAVVTFWNELVGWTADSSPLPQGGDYYTFRHDGHPAAGMMAMPGDVDAQVPSAWMVYFAVASVNEAIEQIKQLGGTIHMGPTEAMGVGTFAMASDPQGGHFYVIELNEWPD